MYSSTNKSEPNIVLIIKEKVKEIMETKCDNKLGLMSDFNEDEPVNYDEGQQVNMDEVQQVNNDEGQQVNINEIYYHPSSKFKNYGYNLTLNLIYNRRTKMTYKLKLKKSKLKNDLMNTNCYVKINFRNSRIDPMIFLWECYNNEILNENFIIEFIDGNNQNIDINNIKVISLKKHYKNVENRIKIKSLEIHNGKYKYPNLKFEGYRKEIDIQCIRCGLNFKQTIANHLGVRNGCRDCAKLTMGGFRHTKQTAIAKANEVFGIGRYTYGNVPAENFVMRNEYPITCVKCGKDFYQTFESHVTGREGCSRCKPPKKHKTKKADFIKLANKIHIQIRKEPYNFDLLPDEFYRYESIYVICHKHGKFPATGDSILSGRGCPFCINKTEGKLKIWLDSQYDDIYTVLPQFQAEWCKNPKTNRYLPFDFCIKELKLIISLDGNYHYSQESHHNQMRNNNIEDVIDRDILKTVNALENGYSVIRIPQEYVWNDEYNWQDLLKSNIKNYDKPTVKFLDFNNEYQIHRLRMLSFS